MFIRKLEHPNGKTYIQVVEKHSGKYKVLKSFGGSAHNNALAGIERAAKEWIKEKMGVIELDFSGDDTTIETLMDSVSSIKRIGYDLLIGSIFDQIGFGRIEDELFRELVIARVAFPASKLKTTQYLYRYKGRRWSEDQLYYYMDKLYNTQKEMVQQISYQHTLKILGNDISVVFYDVTTTYFEIDRGDDLRKRGFSKDGRHQNPQIVLGLLVSAGGYPLAYDIFEGNKFEGHTILPVINGFKAKYRLDKLIVVADSGMFSKSNIRQLQDNGDEFILGARIKNEKQDIKEKILALDLKNGQSAVIEKDDMNLIITYSDGRAQKDSYNREKGIKRLEKKIKSGKLTKSSINNRGYNKFLKMKGTVEVVFNQEKIQADKKWDGLKGYLTNTTTNKDKAIENYRHLWQIEKAFRISKSDLKIRPIYHRIQPRIEAHICITFTAYKVYKELERQLREMHAGMSADQAIEIADTIHQIILKKPQSGETVKKTLLLTEEQQNLAQLFKFGC